MALIGENALRTRLCDMLGLEFPICAFSHCRDVVVEVIKAGGFAAYGTTHVATADDLDADIRWIRERVGGRAFGIDVAIPATASVAESYEELIAKIPPEYWKFVAEFKAQHQIPEPTGHDHELYWRGWFTQEFYRRQLDVVFDERVPVLASALGNPAFILKNAHALGIKVMGLIGKVRQAQREIEAGIDAVIAQGADAGGHTGNVGTFSLVPRVVSIAGETPVIAAGGATTGQHLVAALALGAVGIWTGTLWVACRESEWNIGLQRRVVEATEDDTIYTRAQTGRPTRLLKTPWLSAFEAPNAPRPLPSPQQWILSSDIRQAAQDHQLTEHMSGAAGQGVGFVTEIKPARQIVLDLMDEAQTALERLTG